MRYKAGEKRDSEDVASRTAKMKRTMAERAKYNGAGKRCKGRCRKWLTLDLFGPKKNWHW
jgi:hypothetical protein